MRRYWLTGILLTAAGCPAGDWPQWGRTNARNMVSPARNLPADFAAGKRTPGGGLDVSGLRNVKWFARMGVHTYGNPTIAGGRIFLGTNDRHFSDTRIRRDRGGVLVCLDERTGRRLWQLHCARYRQKIHGSKFDDLNVGICSSPTVDGDRLYVMTNRGEVLCLDVKGQADGNQGPFTREGEYTAGPGRAAVEIRKSDADILWRFDMIHKLPAAPHDATNCNILRVGELLYVTTGNGVHRSPDEPTALPDAPSLIVLDRTTGKLVATDGEKIGRTVFHGQWSSPSSGTVGGRTLVFFGGGNGRVYAFETPKVSAAATRPATLKKVWHYDCNPADFRFDDDGELVDYWSGDASRARVTRDYMGPNEIIATPVFHKGRVYVAVGRDPVHGYAKGILHCIDAGGKGNITKSGKLWSYRGMSRSISTVSIADDLLYVADITGEVHCLDVDTGKVQWTHDTKQSIWSSTFVADGKVYVGTEQGNLWIFQAGARKKILAKIKLPSELSCTPIAANGVLYIPTGRYLFAVKSPGS